MVGWKSLHNSNDFNDFSLTFSGAVSVFLRLAPILLVGKAEKAIFLSSVPLTLDENAFGDG
jgi:hypothetical protein